MMPCLLAALLLHPVYETLAEIEWNEQTGRLEVALRLDLLDEQWLRNRLARAEADQSRWAVDYLRQRFRIADRPAEGEVDRISYHWIGRDEQGPHAWWYFELEPVDGKPPRWIDVRILREREDSYVHRIVILGQVPRRSLTLTIQRPQASLEPAEHEPVRRQSAPVDR
jgi:hypothetical protein